MAKWSDAVGAAKRAQDSLNEGEADDALRERVAIVLAGLERERHAAEQRAAEAERDRKLLEELEAIRGNMGDHWDWKRTDQEYQGAFRKFGIDPDKLGPEEAGRWIADRSAPIELASFVDDWARVRRRARGKGDPSSLLLLATAKVADPDPWRNEVRGQLAGKNPELLHQLANDEKRLGAQPAMSLVILALAVLDQGDRKQSRALLQRARRAKPDDFWVNFGLAEAEFHEESAVKLEEAVRFLTAATSIRPRSPAAHSNLGSALHQQGKLDEAIAEFRTALRLEPDFADAYNNLGAALGGQGKLDEAIAEFRTALRLNPDYALAHNNLGAALGDQGKLDEAIAELRTALRLRPDYADAHYGLGGALDDEGKQDEAIAEFHTALRLKPDYADAHNGLGGALFHQGKLDEAIAEFRTALRLKPDSVDAHNNLGGALLRLGKLAEAIAEFRTAVLLKPDHPAAYGNLGVALRAQGKLDEAIAEFRKRRDLAAPNTQVRQRIEQELSLTERQAALTERLPAVLRGEDQPKNALERLDFGFLCYNLKRFSSSARLFAEAFQADPKLAEDMQVQNRYNAASAAAQAGWGQGKDEPPLDEAARARWRKQAIEWLKADLAFWSRQVESGPQQARAFVVQTLQHGKADSDLSGLRDEAALAKLPEDERKACRSLWTEIDALIKKAQNDRP
jgi:tetratricopeptide (TPR) repeat protein